MAKVSPCVEVRARFESKAALAREVMAHLDRGEGESEADFERRILTVSNRKLLRLHALEVELVSRFGSKAGLVDSIIKLTCGGGVDHQYREKLMTRRVAQLLDLHKGLAKRSKKS